MSNKVKKVLVGSNTNVVTASAGANISTLNLSAGDLLVLDKGFNVLDQATALTNPDADMIYIVAGLGNGRFKISSPIQANEVTSFKATPWSPAVNQTTFIGFNGVTGDITAENNTSYGVRIVFQDDQRLIANRQTAITANYLSDSTATKQEIATGLTKAINKNSLSVLAQAERVSNGAITAFATQSATVTKGSPLVTTSLAHGLTAGNLIGIAGVSYVIAATTTTTITLDNPYTGPSATIAAASAGTGSQAASTIWGIKLSGIAIPTAYPNKYENVTFRVGLFSGLDPAFVPVTYTTKAFRGQGLAIQIREQEFTAQGANGLSNRTLWPIPSETYYSSLSAAGYDQIVIEHLDRHEGDMQQATFSPLATHIAIVGNITTGVRSAQTTAMQGAPSNTGSDATVAILNAWVGKYGVIPPVTL